VRCIVRGQAQPGSDPLSPRSGERARVRGRRPLTLATALLLASLAACGGSSSPPDGTSTPFQSPADSTGGYVIATAAPGTGTPHATVYDSSSGSQLGSFVADAPGAGLSFWFTTPPNHETRIAVRDDAGSNTTYDLTTIYTPVADPFEPNDAMDTAAPMPGDGQMTAFLFAGGAKDPAAFDDHYRFTAQPGALSIHLDDVPADLAARVFLFRAADGTEVARVSNGMRGSALSLTPPALTDATDLIVRVSLWDEAPAASGAGTDLPPSFTQPYRLTVSDRKSVV